MEHEGKRIKALLKKHGFTQKALAKYLAVETNTLHYHLGKQQVKNEFLIKVGKFMRYDITSIFPRLKHVPEGSELNYFNEDPTQVLSQVGDIKKILKESQQVTADRGQELGRRARETGRYVQGVGRRHVTCLAEGGCFSNRGIG